MNLAVLRMVCLAVIFACAADTAVGEKVRIATYNIRVFKENIRADRIRDLKDQQLYRVDKDRSIDYGNFTLLLSKTVDLDIIEEQREAMMHVVISLKHRTAPAHVIVQRLTNSYPSDRLSKAFTNLGRLVKTEYILRYITDPELRRTVQLQLNKQDSLLLLN